MTNQLQLMNIITIIIIIMIIINTIKNIMTSLWWENTSIYSGGSQSVLSGSQRIRDHFPGIRRYTAVMAALRFIFLNYKNDVLLKIISELL